MIQRSKVKLHATLAYRKVGRGAVHERMVGECGGARQPLLVHRFHAQKLEHLPHRVQRVHREPLEQQDFQRHDLRQLQVGGDVLQPAAGHALRPPFEAVLCRWGQFGDRGNVPAPTPAPRFHVEPPLELGPQGGDGVPHQEHHFGGSVVVHVPDGEGEAEEVQGRKQSAQGEGIR